MADISKQLDEMNKGINDKLDFIMEGTVTKEQFNERMSPVEQRIDELVRNSDEMQTRIKDLESEVSRQNRVSRENGMVKVLREQRTRIFLGRVKVRNGINARQLVARAIEDVIEQNAQHCRVTAFLFDIKQITDEACIVTALTASAAKEMLIGLRKNTTVVNEKWRAVPAVPNAQEIKQVVMAADAILGKLKTMKKVKGWITTYGIEGGVYRVYLRIRVPNDQVVDIDLKTDIYKRNDAKIDVLKRVAANMRNVTTDEIMRECVQEIVDGRSRGARGGAEAETRDRPQEQMQMDTTTIGSPPPPAPTESTPRASPPVEGVINEEYPALPPHDNNGSPKLGLIRDQGTGARAKTVVHHQTMLSASTDERMDGAADRETQKQTDKDDLLQWVKADNKRGAEALDKSIDKGEITESEGRKPSAAKKPAPWLSKLT